MIDCKPFLLYSQCVYTQCRTPADTVDYSQNSLTQTGNIISGIIVVLCGTWNLAEEYSLQGMHKQVISILRAKLPGIRTAKTASFIMEIMSMGIELSMKPSENAVLVPVRKPHQSGEKTQLRDPLRDLSCLSLGMTSFYFM